MPLFEKFDEVIHYLAKNRAYPCISKTGKYYFSKTPDDLTKEEETIIWSWLSIKNKEDCIHYKNLIRQEVSLLFPFQKMAQWKPQEQPRERLLQSGPESLTDAQLLSVIIRTGTEGRSAQDLALQLIQQYGNLRALNQASNEELQLIQGLGPAKIAQLKAAMEIGRRMSSEQIIKKQKLINPEKVKTYIENTLQWDLRDSKKEKFAVVFLDTKLKPISFYICTIGSNKESVVDIPDIIRKATQANASAIILVHNHPSGETDPSPEDIESTRRVIQACQLIGVLVVDHIIIGANSEDMFSFASHKIL